MRRPGIRSRRGCGSRHGCQQRMHMRCNCRQARKIECQGACRLIRVEIRGGCEHKTKLL